VLRLPILQLSKQLVKFQIADFRIGLHIVFVIVTLDLVSQRFNPVFNGVVDYYTLRVIPSGHLCHPNIVTAYNNFLSRMTTTILEWTG
jgi:hypothetical protein